LLMNARRGLIPLFILSVCSHGLLIWFGSDSHMFDM
jgi:hypothetical protein